MTARLLQPSLTAGEVAPALYARVDTARYAVGLKRCRNFIVRPYGGVENRAGFRYLANVVDQTHPFRLIPFVFSTEVAYVIELGHYYARFFYGGAPFAIALADAPAWSASGAYTKNDVVSHGGLIYRAKNTGNSVNPPPSAPAGWALATDNTLITPWSGADIFDVRHTQSADVLFMVHPSYPPQQLSRVKPSIFTLGQYINTEGPFRDLNTNEGLKVTASDATGNITVSSNSALFNATCVGALLYIESKNLGLVKPWVVGDRSVAVGSLRRSDGKTYVCTTLSSTAGSTWTETGNRQPIHETGRAWDGAGDQKDNGVQKWNVGVEWEYQDAGYGIVQITARTSSTLVSAVVQKRLPAQVIGVPSAATLTWALTGNDGKVYSIPGVVASQQYNVSINGVPIPSNPYAPTPVGGGGTGPGGTGGGGGGGGGGALTP